MGTPSEMSNLMKVSASTPPQAVAQSIYKAVCEQGQDVSVRAIGAGAINQTVKGIAIARGLVATRGRDLLCAIGFETVKGDSGQDISAQVFHMILR